MMDVFISGPSQWEIYSGANYTGTKYTVIPEFYPTEVYAHFSQSPFGSNNIGSIRKTSTNISK